MDTAVGDDHLEPFVLELRPAGYTLDPQRATELMRMAVARTLERMRLACDLSERVHAACENIGRARG